jgi:Ion channel
MRLLVGTAGAFLIAVVLWEAFETIILPRRVVRRVRLTRLLYLVTWNPWCAIASATRNPRRKEKFLSFFGPLSLIMLFWVWAAGLVFGFALLHWVAGSTFDSSILSGLRADLYFSGSTFFTLGLGDVTPATRAGRVITIFEAGVGIGFFALVISYLPVLYQAFSRREVNISMLDARAGTPPTAGELLRRHQEAGDMQSLDQLLRDWEKWSADLLESHLSYPVLCFFRSQHDNQSWLGALTAVMDACVLAMASPDRPSARQAELTFAMARHAVVDLAQVFGIRPKRPPSDRLAAKDLRRLTEMVAGAGVSLEGGEAERRLTAIRETYEPYVNALGEYLLMALPPWIGSAGARTTGRRAPGTRAIEGQRR